MEHSKHIIRAVGLLVVAAVVFVFGRHFAEPRSFGEHGHYRADSVDEYKALPSTHGVVGACAECHDEEAEAHAAGEHASVSCEVCHGPLRTHVIDDEVVAPMPVDQSSDLCARCHQYLVARPKTFPQVVLRDHVTEKGGEFGETQCVECHDAHNSSE